MSLVNKKILVSSFLISSIFLPTQAWSEDCVDCSIQKEIGTPMAGKIHRPFELTSDVISCTDPVSSFDRIVCDAAHFSKTYQDLQRWIHKCKSHDPKKRSTLLEYYKTIECESIVFDASDKRDPPFATHSAPLASYQMWENKAFSSILDFFSQLKRSYYKEDKKNNDKSYTHLRNFAKVLNKPDRNGLSFLDHVVLSYSDKDCARAGLGADNLRNNLIRQLCVVGVSFALKENKEKYPCQSKPKYAGF